MDSAQQEPDKTEHYDDGSADEQESPLPPLDPADAPVQPTDPDD
jgi:hypothetical protein